MEKNQIFIKTGTKYKKMTRELLEESNLAELIGDKNKMVGIKPTWYPHQIRQMEEQHIRKSWRESWNI